MPDSQLPPPSPFNSKQPHPNKNKKRKKKKRKKEKWLIMFDCVWVLITLLLCFQDSDDISFEAYSRIQHVLTGFWLHALAGMVHLVNTNIFMYFAFLMSCLLCWQAPLLVSASLKMLAWWLLFVVSADEFSPLGSSDSLLVKHHTSDWKVVRVLAGAVGDFFLQS